MFIDKRIVIMNEYEARVAKLVDAADSKSAGVKSVPVRVRPRAPVVYYTS